MLISVMTKLLLQSLSAWGQVRLNKLKGWTCIILRRIHPIVYKHDWRIKSDRSWLHGSTVSDRHIWCLVMITQVGKCCSFKNRLIVASCELHNKLYPPPRVFGLLFLKPQLSRVTSQITYKIEAPFKSSLQYGKGRWYLLFWRKKSLKVHSAWTSCGS